MVSIGLDYDVLIEPYSAPAVDGAPKYTPAGQREWLTMKQGVSGRVADMVMAEVYADIASGTTFESGQELDRCLLIRCRKIMSSETADVVKRNRRELKRIVVNTMKANRGYSKPGMWLRHPLKTIRWFQTGLCIALVSFLLGMGLQWLLTH